MAGERERADARFQAALLESGARDPREYYRERLRELKERDREAYLEAVAYFERTLVPSIASGEAEPLAAWTEYGRRLAELSAPGRTVAVDPSGRARPYEPPAPGDSLILHLPERSATKALLVGLPRTMSPAQQATWDWLGLGRQKLKGSPEG